MFSDFFKGINYFFKGLSFLFSKGLWYYMLYPFLLWVVIFVATLFLIGELVDQFTQWLDNWLSDITLNGFLHFLVAKKPFFIKKLTFLTRILLQMLFLFLG